MSRAGAFLSLLIVGLTSGIVAWLIYNQEDYIGTRLSCGLPCRPTLIVLALCSAG